MVGGEAAALHMVPVLRRERCVADVNVRGALQRTHRPNAPAGSILAKNRNVMTLTSYLVCTLEIVLRHAPENAVREEAAGHVDLEGLCRTAGLSYAAVRMQRSAFNKFLALALGSTMLGLKCDKIVVAGDPEAAKDDECSEMTVTLANVFGSAPTVSQNVQILSQAYSRLFAGARVDIDERYVSGLAAAGMMRMTADNGRVQVVDADGA